MAQAKKLKEGDAKRIVPAMIEGLKDAGWMGRSSLVSLLREMGIKQTTPIDAVNEALRETSDYCRFWFAYKLANTGGEPKKALPLVVEALKHSDAMIRCTAADVLGRIGKDAENVVPALETALDDKDASVRRAAAAALQKIGGKTSLLILVRSLKDQDPLISISAARALGRMGAAAVPALTEALKDPDRIVRARAASALGRIG